MFEVVSNDKSKSEKKLAKAKSLVEEVLNGGTELGVNVTPVISLSVGTLSASLSKVTALDMLVGLKTEVQGHDPMTNITTIREVKRTCRGNAEKALKRVTNEVMEQVDAILNELGQDSEDFWRKRK